MRVIQTQQFRAGFQDIAEPVRVVKYGVDLGIYLPLNEGQPVRKAVTPRLLEAEPATRRSGRPAAVATPRTIQRIDGKVDGRSRAARAAKAAAAAAAGAPVVAQPAAPAPVRRRRARKVHRAPAVQQPMADAGEPQGLVPLHNPGL